ncbi:MAG: hypothetical protein AAGJ82_07690 [Bacteroidota bacterium]
MRFVLSLLFTLLLGWAFQFFLPWYGIALAGLLVGLFYALDQSYQGFLSGFLAGGLLWGGQVWWLSAQNGHLLADRLGVTFSDIGSTAVLLVTALLAAILAGLGVLTGHLGRVAFTAPR